jgi:hypothetical protein
VPVARPVIFTLVGCSAGERCVIERTEDGFLTRGEPTCAANDWRVGDPRYEARLGSRQALVATYEEAAANSRRRCEVVAAWNGTFARDAFAWIVPPVLNRYTRLAVEMCPAAGVLRAVGYEVPRGADVAQPATLPCTLAVERQAA